MNPWEGWASQLLGSLIGGAVGAAVAFWVLVRTLSTQRKLTQDQLDTQSTLQAAQLLEQRKQTERQLTEQRTLLLEANVAEHEAARNTRAMAYGCDALVEMSKAVQRTFRTPGASIGELRPLFIQSQALTARFRAELGVDGAPMSNAIRQMEALTSNLVLRIPTGFTRTALDRMAQQADAVFADAIAQLGDWFSAAPDERRAAFDTFCQRRVDLWNITPEHQRAGWRVSLGSGPDAGENPPEVPMP